MLTGVVDFELCFEIFLLVLLLRAAAAAPAAAAAVLSSTESDCEVVQASDTSDLAFGRSSGSLEANKL